MSLHNVDSSTGELVATGSYGYAVSNKLYAKENIVAYNAIPDMFYTEETINVNDPLRIELDHGSVIDYVVSTISTIENEHEVDILADGSGLALYEMNSSVSDTGSSYDATIDGTELYSSGLYEQAFNFNNNTGVMIPKAIFGGKLPFTVSMWIKTSQIETGDDYWKHRTLFGQANSSNGVGLALYNGKLQTWNGFCSNDVNITTDRFVADDTWHHVVASFTQYHTKIWCDNSLVVDFTYSGDDDIVVDTYDYSLGRIYDDGSAAANSQYDGLMDQIRFFNKELSDAEVSYIYEHENTQYTKVDTSDQTSGNQITYAFQNTGNLNICAVKNIEGKFEFKNISAIEKKAIDVIEPMTNDTSSQGIASASNASNPAYKAFDKVIADAPWYCDWSGSPEWVQFQFTDGIEHNIYSYRMSNQSYSDGVNRMPKDWKLQGSNDGATWTDIDVRTGVTWSFANETKEFVCVNTGKYSYFRLYITANNSSSYVCIEELMLYEYSSIDYIDRLKTDEYLAIGDKIGIILQNGTIVDMKITDIEFNNGYFYVDTSSVTNGEVPYNAFKINENIEVNGELNELYTDSYTSSGLNELNPFEDNSLVHLYKLEENGTDSITGTPATGSTEVSFIDDTMRKYMHCDGYSAEIDCDSVFQSNICSYVIWWKGDLSLLPNYAGAMCSINNSIHGIRFKANGNPTVLIRDDSDHDLNIPLHDYSIYQWHMLVITHDSSELKAYIDNELKSTIAMSGSIDYSNGIAIGRNKHDNSSCVGVSFSRAMIFNRPITEPEISKLYEYQKKILETTRSFENMESLITDNIETKINFSAKGNKMKELKFDLKQ